jgi:serine/threonine-protein kinase
MSGTLYQRRECAPPSRYNRLFSMAELSDPRLGKLLDGRYRLDQRLGAGGMGVVYKGEQVALGKPVAVKLLHDALASIPDLFKRLQREAQAMSKLGHPNLVSVIDSGVAEGVPFLVMDFISGKTLADVLAEGRMPAVRAVRIAKQILAGVSHAHALGVVHRDLKPDNILLLSDVEGDFVKILDFGLAKLVHQSEGTQLTNSGFALGTPGYMSPEQARGAESDERSDLYSVGVILYHLVTGRKPFMADSPLAVLRMHMDDAPVPPTKVVAKACSAELERVILRAMAKEPKARFQSAADFARALAATPEAGSIEAPAPALAGRGEMETVAGKRPSRFGKIGLFGLVGRVIVAGIVIAGFTIGWMQLSRRQQAKVKRGLDDAVKVAEGTYQTVRQRAQSAMNKDEQGAGKHAPAASKPGAPATGKPAPAAGASPAPAAGAPPTPEPQKPAPIAAAPPPAQNPVPVAPPAPEAQEAAPVAPSPTPAAPTPAPPAPAPSTPAAPNNEAVASAAPTATPPKPTSEPEAGASSAGAASLADEEEADETAEEVPIAPEDTPGAKLEEAARATPPGSPPALNNGAGPKVAAASAKTRLPSARDAARLLVAGHVDEAIQTLYDVRRRAPHDSYAALLLGHAYFRKLWRTDGLREYNHAIKINAALRHDGLLIHNTVSALDGKTYRLARAVIKTRIGAAARAQLRREARYGKNARVRQRAARLAQQVGHYRRR